MSEKFSIRDYLTEIGMVTSGFVVLGWFASIFFTEPSIRLCQEFGSFAVGKMEKVRGNLVAIEQYDNDGNVTHRISATTAFTCSAVFGSGWIDALEDFD